MQKIQLLIACLVLLAGSTWSQPVVKPAVEDLLIPSESVTTSGYVGERLAASYKNRILTQEVERLVAPFRNRTETSCWQSEFWGKWFTSAVLAYRYQPLPWLKEKLDEAVSGLLSTQTPDGYIGNYAADKHLAAWDIWGRKYCMLGLLAYHDLTGDQPSLEAARKIADHLISELNQRQVPIVKLGNHRGMAATSVLEPICLLYARTGQKKYLDFAEDIVRQWETPDGPQLISKSTVDVADRFPKPQVNWYGPEQGQKAYEMMSCYEGLLELYRLTGKAEYKKAVENTWESIHKTEINVAGSGSSVECWFHGNDHQDRPVYHYQETCVTVTWIKLSQQLLRLTGETKYADAIEQTFYNALLASMNSDGSDWAKYTPLAGQRLKGTEQCGMGLNCCTASGPRGLFTFPLTAVMSGSRGIRVNFFAPGSYEVTSPERQKMKVIQETDYPESGKIRIILQLEKPENMQVSVRIPAWSIESTLLINGAPVPVEAGKAAEIQRLWKTADQIELILDMRGRIIQAGSSPGSYAIMRGPVLLARDERLSPPALEAVLQPVAGKNGFIELLVPDQKKAGFRMTFTGRFIPESYAEKGSDPVPLLLCDYASAGYATDTLPFFKVWFPQLFDPRN